MSTTVSIPTPTTAETAGATNAANAATPSDATSVNDADTRNDRTEMFSTAGSATENTAQTEHFAPATPAQQPAGTERARTFAITSFVLGIASVVSGWTFVAPVVGLIFGILALRRSTSERGFALWGVWLNAAMLALSVIAVFTIAVLIGAGIFVMPFIAV